MKTQVGNGLRRRRKAFLWGVLFVLVASMALPTGAYLFTGTGVAAEGGEQTNPRANFWRAVRSGNEGYTAVRGQETNVLIQNGGQNWRQIRNGPITVFGVAVLGFSAAFLLLYAFIHGRVRIEGELTGRKVERWSVFNRTLHWYTAILFIILAITGLSLLFGRAVLIPLLGLEGFSVWADVSKVIHNYVGPAFSVGVVLILVLWLRFNLPEKSDWQWFKAGGGLIGKGRHPHCGFINPGEKLFTYGSMLVLGVAVVVTGFILDFPNYDQTRATMQIANIIHDVAGMLWIAVMLGHIYLGLWGVEGSLSAMVSGDVDEAWAKQHHDLWLEEVRQGEGEGKTAPSGSAPREQTT